MSWVIVGLGNPGLEYEVTRHNAGRDAVRFFGSKTDFIDWRQNSKALALVAQNKKVTLVLPDTYMNRSGSAVAKFVKSVKAAERLAVVHDDLHLPPGTVKRSRGRRGGGL